LEFRNTATGTYECALGIGTGSSIGISVRNCIIYDTSFIGLGVNGHFIKIRRNIVYGCGDGINLTLDYTDGGYVYDNTVLNCTRGIRYNGYCRAILKNNYSGGCSTADYSDGGDCILAWATNHSSDGTGTTTTTSVVNCHFTNSTAGSEDCHIDATSALKDVGTDLHADAYDPHNTDALGNSIPNGAWDVGAIEYVSSGQAYTRSISDTLGMTDSLSNSRGLYRSIADMLSFTDIISYVLNHSIFRTISDTLGVTDSIVRRGIFHRSISDIETITDGDLVTMKEVYVDLADTFGVTDYITRSGVFSRSISDTLGITDLITRISNKFRSLSDMLSTTDIISSIIQGLHYFYRTISDTFGVTDSLSRSGVFHRSISDTLRITDLITRTGIFIRSISDTLRITDILSRIKSGTGSIINIILRRKNDLYY